MGDRLKILFISMEYPPETGGGGIGSYLVSIAPALAALGHDVHVLSAVHGQASRDYVDHGVTIHRRGQTRVRGLGRLRAPHTTARIRAGLSAFIEFHRLQAKFDVIEYPDWGAEGWVFALARPVPLVAQLHTPLPLIQQHNGLRLDRDSRIATFLERLSVRRAHVISSSSQLLVSALGDIGWLKARTVEVIPYAVDWIRWQDVPDVLNTNPTVLYLGRLERRKAPEVLASAIRILRADIPDARAMFVGRCGGRYGDTSYADWIKGLARDSASGCVHVEQMPRHELRGVLASARVLALPSWFDSYGMVAVEAMAAGRPVVVTEQTGVAEFVREAGGGRVVPSDNAEALAESLRPFLRDANHAHDVGQAGYSAVRTHLDPDRIAARRVALYRRAQQAFAARGRCSLKTADEP
ncbi:MAG: glycosyltransferase family 4 protein [candidate division NC10 bacterium]|nr:glycosyltransferase family 4 protein [candidate division NC10 bacterium]